VTPPRAVNVADLVEQGRVGRGQVGAFAVLCAALVLDGFDVQVLGYAAPALIEAWGIPKTDLAPVFGAGLFGLFLGSILGGMAADRWGRRPVLLAATALFAVFTLAAAQAGSLRELLGLRLLSGLGLGAIMPNATALTGEYSPRRRRVATMMIVTNGFLVGAMLAGFLAAWLIPLAGWRALFLVGGVAPLLLLLPMAVLLPESLQFLALRGGRPERIARWLRLVGAAAPAGEEVRYLAEEAPRQGLPLAQLFRGGRAPGTLLLWAVNFLNVLNAYFIASWLPTLVREAGHPTSTAVLVGTAVQAGGAIGTVVLGFVMQRTGFVKVLTACFAVAAANLALIGQPGLPPWALVAVAFLLGWGIFGGQPGVNALAATWYPTDLRTTGLGAALGVGRFGAILGPLLAGALMLRQWTTQELFQAAAVPAAVAAALVFATRWVIETPRPGGGP